VKSGCGVKLHARCSHAEDSGKQREMSSSSQDLLMRWCHNDNSAPGRLSGARLAHSGQRGEGSIRWFATIPQFLAAGTPAQFDSAAAQQVEQKEPHRLLVGSRCHEFRNSPPMGGYRTRASRCRAAVRRLAQQYEQWHVSPACPVSLHGLLPMGRYRCCHR
jgi:hypothetical protein